MEFSEHEELVHQFAIPDLEFGSMMATELGNVDKIEVEIIKLEKKASILRAQAHFMGGTMWERFFEKYPNNHPTDFKEKKPNTMRFDSESHTVYLLKNNRV